MPQPGACLRLHPLPRQCPYPNLGVFILRLCMFKRNILDSTAKMIGIRITNNGYLVPQREDQRMDRKDCIFFLISGFLFVALFLLSEDVATELMRAMD